MSRLRRIAVSGRFFFITCNRLPRHRTLRDCDFECLAEAISVSRASTHFLLTAWVFLPDHWHGLIFPRYPLTISHVMKVVKGHATYDINQQRQETGQLWQPRCFDRIARRVREYHDYVEYIHFNPVRRGLVKRTEEWKWSSIHEYGGPMEPILKIDRILLPADQNAFL